jgi:hypothetical protein
VSVEVTESDTPQQITIPLSFVPQFADWVDLNLVLGHETTDDEDLKLLSLTYPYDKIELEISGDDLPEPDESLYVRVIGARPTRPPWRGRFRSRVPGFTTQWSD